MKHLEMVQNAITRMGANGANLKGFCMTLVAAIIGLAAAVSKEQILLYTIPVIVGFSILDGMYLSLEKGFRDHYDDVRLSTLDKEPDFQIYAKPYSLCKAYFSWSVFVFYFAVISVMFVVSLLMPEVVTATG